MNIDRDHLIYFSKTSSTEFWDLYNEYHNGRPDTWKVDYDSKGRILFYIETKFYEEVRKKSND